MRGLQYLPVFSQYPHEQARNDIKRIPPPKSFKFNLILEHTSLKSMYTCISVVLVKKNSFSFGFGKSFA